jgi:site-specific DNA recombinase
MRAAIYCRISSDKSGEGLGVQRQQEDCERLAADKGWDVTQVLVENDVSAFSGKRRPQYEVLLSLIANGQIDVVIAWSHDRLHRRPKELEKFIDVSERARVDTYTVKAGHFDLSTPSGRAVARTLAAWANYETETSTARVKAAKLQQARRGAWSGGQRPWGYEPGCTAIRENEAVIYRELVDRVIAGESFRQCAMDLHKRGIRTQHGAEWSALKIRNLLLRARYAGLREHHEALYTAEWPAVITKEKWDQLQLAIKQHKRDHYRSGPMRKYLLTGIAYCGGCGHRMNTCPKSGGNYTRYACLKRTGGCGRMYRRIEPVDYLIKEAIIYRLDTDSLSELLAQEDDKAVETKELLRQRDELQARLKARMHDYDDGLLSRSDYAELKQRSESALHDVERKLEAAGRARTGMHLIPAGQTVRDAWDSHDLSWRRQLVGLLIEKVVIHPSNTTGLKKAEYFQGKWQFKPGDVQVIWKC